MKRISTIGLSAVLAVAASGCAMNMGEEGMDDGMRTGAAVDTRASASGRMNYPMVGGAAMYPNRNIVQNAVNSRDHTTLVSAVQAAGLADTLMGAGPFTVFAPTNAAFDRLPAGTVSNLMMPQNRDQLRSVLTFHVVPGNYSAAELKSLIAASPNRVATLRTVNGGMLRVTMEGNNIVLMGENNSKAYVTQGDVRQSNGMIHVVNGVLIPRMNM